MRYVTLSNQKDHLPCFLFTLCLNRSPFPSLPFPLLLSKATMSNLYSLSFSLSLSLSLPNTSSLNNCLSLSPYCSLCLLHSTYLSVSLSHTPPRLSIIQSLSISQLTLTFSPSHSQLLPAEALTRAMTSISQEECLRTAYSAAQ